jgi:phosphatidylglycerol:prolipoprotein diacylglycerol transferase
MEGIYIGPFLFRWGGLLVMVGVAAGGMLANHEAKRRGYDSDIILDFILPMMVWGTIGARLWHVFTPPLSSLQLGLTTGHYLTHPLDLLALWIGGFGFPGALLGGIFALFLFTKIYKYNFYELADILAPAIALGQAIGRLGNFFNQELYGLPTNLPWGIFISVEHRLAGYESIEFYHPLFAYEVILNLANLGILFWLSRKYETKLIPGSLFFIYLFNAAITRALLEFLRLDVALVYGINVNQAAMALIAVVSFLAFSLRNRSVQKL